MTKFSIAALAALFALSSTSAIVFGSAQQSASAQPGLFSNQPAIASADRGDENDQGDEGDQGHHDNGKHKGWYKHKNDQGNGYAGSARRLTGVVTGINGNTVSLRLSNGQYINVNDQNAANNGALPSLWVGERVRLSGNYDNNGVFYANSIAQYGNANPNQVAYGTCGANYGGTSETIVGYATGGVDGNGNFGLQTTPVQNIPIPVGPRYTVHVSGSTCVNGQQIGNVQLDLGRHIKVSGIPAGNGNVINATNIWYV